jgi:hypothetical protein
VDGYLPSSEGGSAKETPTISKEFQAIPERKKKRVNDEAISKQVQAILKRKQSHEVKGHHKYVPPRSPHKKNLHQPQKQVYKSPRMHGTTGKKAVDSHSPPLAKA